MQSLRSFQLYDDDLVIRGGNLQLIDGDEEKCQCVERAITTRITEWFLNRYHGMDYEELKEKNPDLERIKMDITEAALQEGRLRFVKEIRIDFDKPKRFATVHFIGVLENGEEIEVRGVNI